MMINNDGTISINRGDVFKAPLFINGGTKDNPIRYSIGEHIQSKVYFSIMEPNQDFYNGIIRRTYDYTDVNQHGDVVVKLTSSETKQLMQGKYYYQFKILMDDGTLNTITDREILYVR